MSPLILLVLDPDLTGGEDADAAGLAVCSWLEANLQGPVIDLLNGWEEHRHAGCLSWLGLKH